MKYHDRIIRKPLDALLPYARNARTHSDEQVAQIAASMREWGWTNPVLITPDGTIVAGHGRVMAARLLGVTEVPCIVAEGWTETQIRAYVIADNKLALNAGWDLPLLRLELQDLDTGEFDLELTGFSVGELEDLLTWAPDGTAAGLTDPDDVPDLLPEAVSRAGDIWILGNHRLMCGDSTVAAEVAELLAGVQPHLMVTDPPYGVEYDPNWRNEADRADGKAIGARAVGKVENDNRADWRESWTLFPGDVAYVWHAGRFAATVQSSLEDMGFEVRSQIIWAKPRFAISRGHYHWQHEPCWYAVRKGKAGHWHGDRAQTTLWQVAHNKSETGHGTQKPVECMLRPMLNNSSPGQAVYEPFSGSGTTIIAAEQSGRVCYAMELSARYVDVAVRRWQQFTGKRAVLESTGEPFPDDSAG